MNNNQRLQIGFAILVGAGLLYLLRPALLPFITALIFAYIGMPLVTRLTMIGLPRVWAVGLMFFVFIAAVIGGVLWLIPILVQQLQELPELLEWFQTDIIPQAMQYIGVTQQDLEWVAFSDMSIQWTRLFNITGDILSDISRSGKVIGQLIGLILLMPVVTYYLLRDWEKLLLLLRDMVPYDWRKTVLPFMVECDQVISAFLRAQFFIISIMAVIYIIGLWLIGINFAVLLGALIALGSLIPYVGILVGAIIGTVVIIIQFQDAWLMPLVWALTLLFVGHLFESFVLHPWLMSDRLGLHPMVIIFALLCGGQLFGVIGLLLAIPTAAVIFVLLRHMRARYKESALYIGKDN